MSEAVKLPHKGKKETSNYILFLLRSTISAFNSAQAILKIIQLLTAGYHKASPHVVWWIESGMLRWARHMSFKGRTETTHDILCLKLVYVLQISIPHDILCLKLVYVLQISLPHDILCLKLVYVLQISLPHDILCLKLVYVLQISIPHDILFLKLVYVLQISLPMTYCF